MRWQALLAETAHLAANHSADPEITEVVYDSRQVRPAAIPSTLFVAMQGGSADGNRFLRQAIDAGAAAILTDSRESFAFLDSKDLPVALVEHGRRALAQSSAALFGHPERRLALTAVTGTNGKTTTAFLTEQLLQQAGRTTVLIGTIETHVAGEIRPSEHTTPESRDLLATFRDGVDRGATEAVMEMSSHALDQERIYGLPVDIAIFTNLTQDHLDYHGTMDTYATAKARLFQGVGAPPPRIAILNADDPYFGTMRNAASACETIWTYSLLDPAAAFTATGIHYRAGQTSFVMNTPFGSAEITSNLTGRVNVYNLLAAITAALGRGLSFENVLTAIPALHPVPGRFETVLNTLGFTVVVDYAHTDDALRNLIALARELATANHKPTSKPGTPPSSQASSRRRWDRTTDHHPGAPCLASETWVSTARVLTLFGCGGDRDRTKRPKMGRAAGEGSDIVLITSDNPRSEDPAAIAEEALTGVRQTNCPTVLTELDRAAAIHLILQEAKPGDIVLIAGKGHEKTQTSNGIATPFDDVAVAAAALRDLETTAGT